MRSLINLSFILFFIISITESRLCVAQETKTERLPVVLGSEIEAEPDEIQFLGGGDDYFFVRNDDKLIYSIDNKTSIIKGVLLNKKITDLKKSKFEKSIVFGNNLYCFFSDYDRNNNKLLIFVTIVSLECDLLTKDNLICAIDSKNKSAITYNISMIDENKFIIRSDVFIDQYENELSVFKFDKRLKLLDKCVFNNKQVRNKRAGELLFPEYGFSDDLFLFSIFIEKDKSTFKKISSVIGYDKNGKQSLIQDLNTNNVSLFNHHVARTQNSLFIIANYSDDITKGMSGVVVFEYSELLKKFTLKSTTPFSEELKSSFSVKAFLMNKVGVPEFEFITHSVRSDSSFFILNMPVRIHSYRTSSPGGGSSTERYKQFGGFQLVEHFGYDGKLLSGFKINSSISTSDLNAINPYNLLNIGNRTLLYYTDNPSSKDKSKSFYQKNIYYYDLTSFNTNKDFQQIELDVNKDLDIPFIFRTKGNAKFVAIVANHISFFRYIFGAQSKVQFGVFSLKE